MTILLTGSTGLIGSAVAEFAKAHDLKVRTLKRGSPEWDPEHYICAQEVFDDVDAVIHLSGENIAAHRWSHKQKQKLWNSRVLSTQLLVNTIERCPKKPKLFLCASAVGLYGDRGDEILTESSPAGKGFLSELCSAWEQSAGQAEKWGVRVVNLRFGVVLSRQGGMLASLLPLFRWGGGGVLGSGKQWMSWIALEDVIGIIKTVLENERIEGGVNVASPNPVTNQEFTKTLGSLLKRPTFFHCPAFAARLAFGEMADSLLLSSTRAVPEKITQAGYTFLQPTLLQALQAQV